MKLLLVLRQLLWVPPRLKQGTSACGAWSWLLQRMWLLPGGLKSMGALQQVQMRRRAAR